MGVRSLLTLCVALLLAGSGIETTPNAVLCQLGKQMNKDMSSFGCPVDTVDLYKNLLEKMKAGTNKVTPENPLQFLLKGKGSGIETAPMNMLCQLGKQMNKDMSKFGCPVDAMALYKNLVEKMEAGTNKIKTETPLQTLLHNMGMNSNSAKSDVLSQIAKLLKPGSVPANDLMKLLKDFKPTGKDETTAETNLQTLLKDLSSTGNTGKAIPIDIFSAILNSPMLNSQVVKNFGMNGRNDPPAKTPQVSDILRSQMPQSKSLDLSALSKALSMEGNKKSTPQPTALDLSALSKALSMEGDKKSMSQPTNLDLSALSKALNRENEKEPTKQSKTLDFSVLPKALSMEGDMKQKLKMSITNFQKLAAYQASLKPLENQFMLEFVQMIPPSLESKILTIAIDMIENNKRPLDIAKSVVVLLPDSVKYRAIQTIAKYESNVTEDIKAESIKLKKMDILKWPGWKSVFDKGPQYEMFEDMALFLESSYGPENFMWLHGFVNWVNTEAWPQKLWNQVLSIINKNENLKSALVENIMADKEISGFVYRIHLWMQTQNFSNSSPEIQMIRDFILNMNFSAHNGQQKWMQGFFNWLDGNFGELGGWTTTMKVVSNTMFNASWISPLLKETAVDKKIHFNVIIQNRKSVCNRSLSGVRQSIENILIIAERAGNLCGQKTVKFLERASLIDKEEKGKRIYAINGIADNNEFKWVTYIKREGEILLKDVDVSYIPRNGDHIDLMYLHPSAVV